MIAFPDSDAPVDGVGTIKQKKVISYIPKTAKCLEVGPFFSPKLVGKHVKYFDILSTEQLKKRFEEVNGKTNIKRKIKKIVDVITRDGINKIPNIDYTQPNGDLKIIDETFDVVLSSHTIEHQTDFIQHLKDVSALLQPSGTYVVIIPDKRYCFDHFIKTSTIADIVADHYDKRNNHSLKSVIEHRVLTCHNLPRKHWENKHNVPRINENPKILGQAIKEYFDSVENNTYIDVHNYQFTPKSFYDIIHILLANKLINLQIDKLYPTPKNVAEFCVVLKKCKE